MVGSASKASKLSWRASLRHIEEDLEQAVSDVGMMG
jgi:hypothetical protein